MENKIIQLKAAEWPENASMFLLRGLPSTIFGPLEDAIYLYIIRVT